MLLLLLPRKQERKSIKGTLTPIINLSRVKQPLFRRKPNRNLLNKASQFFQTRLKLKKESSNRMPERPVCQNQKESQTPRFPRRRSPPKSTMYQREKPPQRTTKELRGLQATQPSTYSLSILKASWVWCARTRKQKYKMIYSENTLKLWRRNANHPRTS